MSLSEVLDGLQKDEVQELDRLVVVRRLHDGVEVDRVAPQFQGLELLVSLASTAVARRQPLAPAWRSAS